MKTRILILTSLLICLTTLAHANGPSEVSCTERVDVVPREDGGVNYVAAGRYVIIRKTDTAWEMISGDSVTSPKNSFSARRDRLDTCQVRYASGESNPPHYFFTAINCQGDDRMADGAKVDLSIKYTSDDGGKMKLTIDAEANNFGEIRTLQTVELFKSCSVRFR